MKIIDAFLFSDELDLLELRLEMLGPHVDYFVISEASETFSGIKKPLNFKNNKKRYNKFAAKIIHNIVDTSSSLESPPQGIEEYYTKLDGSLPHKHRGLMPRSLHKTVRREIYQRDSIVNGILKVASRDDIVLLSDVDELPNPLALNNMRTLFDSARIYHFKQKWCMYWINNMSDLDWYGTRAFSIEKLKNKSVDQMRYPTEDPSLFLSDIVEQGGWHFSYLGGVEKIRNKLNSLAHQGRREKISRLLNFVFPGRLERLLINNNDIMMQGRKFREVEIDFSYPSYLRENINKYAGWLKN